MDDDKKKVEEPQPSETENINTSEENASIGEAPAEPSDSVTEEVKVESPAPVSDEYKVDINKSADKKPKKKLVLLLLGLLLLIAAAVGAYIFMSGDDTADTASTEQVADEVAKLKAVVSVVDGSAQYSADGENWQDLKGEETLNEGQYVRTDATSRVVLVLDDGSAVRLNNSSAVFLQSLLPSDVKIVNTTGEVYTRVVTSERQFTVVAAEVDYVAKGTAYKTVNTETQKGVVVYQSTVAVSKTSSDVTEGKQYFEVHPNVEIEDKVTDIPVEELKSDAFAKWNLELDKQSTEFKDKLGYLTKIEEQAAPAPAPAPVPSTPSAGITLSGSAVDKGIYFSWTTVGLNTKDGFKLVRSTKSNTPTYGKDSADYIGGESTREYTAKLTDGKTYYFRICRYVNGSCDVYSNTVQVTAPYVAPEPVQAGAVVLTNSGYTINWTFSGTAPHGFKLLLSSSPNPTSAIKLLDKNTSSFDMTPKLSSGNNYVKVCKYTGDDKVSGGITDCSNELVLNKP